MPALASAAPMPCRWYCGSTASGARPTPRPWLLRVGLNSTWPTILLSSATSDTAACPASRSASTRRASASLGNAAACTAWMAAASPTPSGRICRASPLPREDLPGDDRLREEADCEGERAAPRHGEGIRQHVRDTRPEINDGGGRDGAAAHAERMRGEHQRGEHYQVLDSVVMRLHH